MMKWAIAQGPAPRQDQKLEPELHGNGRLGLPRSTRFCPIFGYACVHRPLPSPDWGLSRQEEENRHATT